MEQNGKSMKEPNQQEIQNNFKKKYLASIKNNQGFKEINKESISFIENTINSRPAEAVIACEKGCSYCCSIRVEAFAHEIVGIYEYLNSSLNHQDLLLFKNKISSASQKNHHLSENQRIITNITCPLLDDDNHCTVHNIRPITCAAYHSMDVKRCIDMFENPTLTPPTTYYAVINSARDYFYSNYQSVLNSLNHDDSVYELTVTLDQLFKNPKFIKRWRKGKKLIP